MAKSFSAVTPPNTSSTDHTVSIPEAAVLAVPCTADFLVNTIHCDPCLVFNAWLVLNTWLLFSGTLNTTIPYHQGNMVI